MLKWWKCYLCSVKLVIWKTLSAVRSRLRSTDGVSQRSLLTEAMHTASKFSFALYPCSDFPLLGVSAVKFDATLGLISGSPIFLFLHNSCSAILRVLSNSNATWASCSTPVFVQNVLSQVQPFCTSAACQLIFLLDGWCLLRAPCCTDCQHTDSRIASPKHCHIPDVSHSVSSLHLMASTAEVHRCGQACRQKTPRIHLMFDLAPSFEWFRPKQISPNGTTSPVYPCQG